MPLILREVGQPASRLIAYKRFITHRFMETEEVKPLTCEHCRRTLDQGIDVLAIQEGVIGPRGFVPLEDHLFLCGEECREAYFCDPAEERVKLPRRIP